MNIKSSKGFTLIELLVVVAIISLLSSVVLTSLKDARDKAKASAFRQSTNQFINALELYKSTNNNYPGADGEQYTTDINGVNTTNTSVGLLNLPTILSAYIKKIPTPYQSGSFWIYRKQRPEGTTGFFLRTKCVGDTIIPPYAIVISGKGFENLPYMTNSFNGTNWSIATSYRCFSPK